MHHLDTALALEVEPLDYCANRFGLGTELVMARAAEWAGLAFSPVVPHTRPGSPIIDRIERLGETRTIRGELYQREVIYSAPRFTEFIALKRHLARDPDFHRRFCVVPLSAIRAELAAASEEALLDEARQRLVRKWPNASGSISTPISSRIGFALLALLLVLVVLIGPTIWQEAFLPLVAVLLLIPALMRLWAAVSRIPSPAPPTPLDDYELPTYSVLVPLRDEAEMVPQLVDALGHLDYPPEKLRIHFIVEASSAETVAAVRQELSDPRFELIVVPDAMPRTKPKAMNYALPMVTGEFLVVYDAEDIPEPDQLRLAASTFAVWPDVDCLQAELVIDNAHENLLTAWFAGEYAGQFGLMLPLLSRLDLPMPLGGTSNHFRVSALRDLGGWDSFNVTEDADLGVRLARAGLRTATIDSRTSEEAPITVGAWLKQRTRWMKGWMQTLLVHNSDMPSLWRGLGWRGFLGFQIYVGSMVLSAPLHTAFMLGFIPWLLWGGPSGEPPSVWDIVAAATFLIGYAGPALLVVIGLRRLGRTDLLPQQFLLPFYWMLHSVAVILAAIELVRMPHFWAKTKHGATKVSRGREAPVSVPAQAE
ncbi:MAG: glycosyltransferase [Devosia sp.]